MAHEALSTWRYRDERVEGVPSAQNAADGFCATSVNSRQAEKRAARCLR